ncbi:MAPEG family protein [Hyphomicrobium sp.]|uniref:MAPEG family protein n=1 Tax=Hyphomicrobium sp. TaxID=82 RepID=UPI0025BAB6A2|nr:MAPEG family protein [Hyphomicrobium sp.]MCC7252089.1 MAPEG family protein [Hyphomicrobium sp.]
MNQTAILYPVFVQVALTFFLQGWMRIERAGAYKRGDVQFSDVSLRQQKWPARAAQISNAFHNQLETPVLFYAVVAFLMITSQVSIVFVILAWLFVVARLYHAYIHTGPNKQPYRFYGYAASSVVLFVMWVLFAIRILFFSATGA